MLVKWWLLAIPQYLIVAVFVGGWGHIFGPGLAGLLVLIAAIALVFKDRYPPGIFDFVMGMNRWTVRVTAYAALMSDAYPPFRLDMGGVDPNPQTGGGPA